ncbi:unnamed protein product [Brachionus calyciflorus]|uniref:Phosphorylated adapter RNA export protein n=1 Tax=Brachionus calyciflorus TaxID=104777 RepID=A0A813M3D4_9BILA|nr:unnamed protein product [Brachionus calyciflorus]
MSKLNIKKFNLWSDTLNEESLCDTIQTFDLAEEKPNKERGVESYKYENKNLSDLDLKKKRSKFKRNKSIEYSKRSKSADRHEDLKERIGPKITFDENRSRTHIRVTELDSDEAVTKEIVRVLREPKDDVIQRCVKVLGKKKCLELLYATEDVEKLGGMPTSDGYRRRTPGGVYFQLIKKDDIILNCQRSQIFIEDVARKKKQKALKRLRQRQRFNEAKKDLREKIENDISGNKDVNNQNELNEINDEFESVVEEGMIYFDE